MSTVKIHIKQARNLPVMDRASNLTDAYVQIKFGSNHEETTQVAKKTLHPTFNQTFRFEVDDVAYIQDNVIEFVLWDSDLVSDDIIGTVYVDANLLLGDLHQMSGWLPIFDSFRGVCGELYVSIKVDCLHNSNPFKDSSAGVKFFSNCVQSLVSNYANASMNAMNTPNSALATPLSALSSHTESSISSSASNAYFEMSKINMIEELLIDDDPERDYWKDKIRSSRTSNLQRQVLLFQLSGKVRRLIGKKVLEAGCNTVIGYYEHFDLEAENIIVRGMGTQCRLDKVQQPVLVVEHSIFDVAVAPRKLSVSPSAFSLSFSRSPQLANSVDTVSNVLKLTTVEDVALCTMKSFEPGEIKHMAQVVQARSVKLLSDMKIEQLGKERDQWWNEMRQEIRENTRALGCTHVIGYSEKVHMHSKGNVCILSAEGTAAILSDNMYGAELQPQPSNCPYAIFHSQFLENSPFTPKQTYNCKYCKTNMIPEIVFTTCEIPSGIAYVNMHFLEARVCRMKTKKLGERNAKLVSSMLPFLEYDLHKQMLHKMKIYHVNAVFNVTYNIAVDDLYIISTVTGTGVYLECLPEISSMQFSFNRMTQHMKHAQHQIDKLSTGYKQNAHNQISETFTAVGEEDDIDLDLDSIENTRTITGTLADEVKTGYIIEIDDETDEDKMLTLLDPILPGGVVFSNLRTLNDNLTQGTTVQNIFLQKRFNLAKLGLQQREHQLMAGIYNNMYSSVAFKLRIFVDGSNHHHSIHVAGISTDLQFVSESELMLTFEAMAILNPKPTPSVFSQAYYSIPSAERLPELLPKQVFMPLPQVTSVQPSTSRMPEDNLIFSMEDSHAEELNEIDEDTDWLNNVYVTMTPLSFVPGARVQKVLGKVTQHLIRESETISSFSAFQQELIMEANAIIRAHTKALSMNCLLNYNVKFHVVIDNSVRRQGYAVVTVSGDACHIVHESKRARGLRSIVALSS